MNFRSQSAASIMASVPFMSTVLAVTVIGAIMSVAFPNVDWFKAIYFLVPFLVLAMEMANTKPRYMPSLSYPGGRWIAPLAMCLIVLAALSRLALGGTPDIMDVNGEMQRVAVNHGKTRAVSIIEFYWLVVSLPLAMTALLIHCLLEHRWRYARSCHAR